MAKKDGSEIVVRRRILQHLGERVRDHRRKAGLTQEQLAERLYLSDAYVSLIERGGRNPPVTTVIQIARALGVRSDDLCT
jgi:transcriptional regulator with XRE-family HTH domain